MACLQRERWAGHFLVERSCEPLALVGWDVAGMAFSFLGQSVPSFWLGILLILVLGVNLIADGGMVEVRYEVVDAAKGGRIHRDTALKDLPVVVTDPGGGQVTSKDLMFHIHRGAGGHDEGRAYSVVYGNAGGVVKPGAWVTLRMSDGLVLSRVPVTV